MSGRITPISVLMCEDIRSEMGGGHSLIGVAQPGLICPSFPARRRASFALIANLEEPGDVKLTFTLKWKGEERWSEDSVYRVEGKEAGTMIPVVGTVAGFDEPGTLSLEVSTEQGTSFVQDWSIEGSDEETDEDG